MTPPRQPDGRSTVKPAPQTADETLVDIGAPGHFGGNEEKRNGQPLQVAVATDVGRVRRNNEDYVSAQRVADADGRAFGLWLVADGVGGGPQGERASRMAVETVSDYMTHEQWTDPARALTEAFALANHNVYEISEGSAATTLVVALVSEADGCVFISNVGDSRAYLVAGGQAQPITDDHSVVAARVAAGQITAAEARTASDRNVLTRSIGSETEVLVDVFGPRQLQTNERLVLCTDGVHGMIDDATIARLASGLPIGEAPAALVAASNEAGGRDNATALVGGYGQAAAAALPLPLVAALPLAVHRPPGRAFVAAGVAALAVLGLAALLVLGAFSGSPGSTATATPTRTATATPTRTATAPATSTPATTAPATTAPAPTAPAPTAPADTP